MKDNSKIISEMAVGMGAAAGPMGEDDFDMGGPPEDLGGEGLGDELDGLGEEGLEGEEDCVSCDKNMLQELLSAVEAGETSAEAAFEQLCADTEEEGLEGLEGLEDEGSMGDMGGLGMDMGGPMECMEDVQKIANLITEDPDIFG
jgi:hypothetical protein